jgi:hypothetical protein
MMSQRKHYFLVAAIGILTVGVAAPQSNAQVLLQDNFDSYVNQAAFQAAWTQTVAANGGGGQLQSTNPAGFSSPNAILDLGNGTATSRNDRALSSAYTPIPGAPLQFQFEFYDSNGAAAAYRQVATIVSGTANASGQLISLGMNNNIASNLYMARVLGVDGGNGSGAFFQLAGTPTRSTGWHTLEALISTDGTTNSINFFVDGTQSTTVATGFTLRSYDTVRLGSGITATQNAAFDDVLVQIPSAVPEPTSLALVGAAGFGWMIRRLRRRAV